MRASRPIVIEIVAAALLGGAACDTDPDPVDTSTGPPPVVSPAPVVSAKPPSPEAPSPEASSPADLPPITVAAPTSGEEITSPVLVSGTADVFEATVSMRIVDASGHVLVRDFTTATCGTGCRGEYEKSLEFDVAEPQDGTVEVWWDSPKDGSRQDVVRIPVRLLP